jgi:hypothetical protein
MVLHYIRKRIVKLEERIAELDDENGMGALNMDGMPHGTTPGNPVERLALAKAALHEKLVNLKATLLERELAIREYLDTVEPEDVKLIMEMRFIQLKDWYEIAGELAEISGKWVDRTTPSKKMRKYLREHSG